MDTYGPVWITLRIAEMSGEFEAGPRNPGRARLAVSSSTKAITKGIAIATMIRGATSLFGSFAEAVLLAMNRAGQEFPIGIDHPDVLVGLLLGGSVAFLFSSLAPIRAVGRATMRVVVGPEPVPRPPGDRGLHDRTTGGSSTSARRPRSARRRRLGSWRCWAR